MALKDNIDLENIDLVKMYKKERRRLKNSIKYSLSGLKMAYANEGSLRLHTTMTIAVIVFGIIFKLSITDMILSMIMMGIILGVELLNTAIESCVDLVTLDIHPLAKRAKDIGSAAAFMMSMWTLVGEVVIFFPYIKAFFTK